MNNDYTHLVVLLDRSGSMSGCWKDTIGGLETLIEDQKKLDGKMTLTLAIFDTEYQVPYNNVDIKSISSLKEVATPRGGTALYDSFVRLVNDTGSHLNRMTESEKPGKILFVVVTDGEENSSKIFRLSDVKEKLNHQKDKYSWNFMFLGADFDANKLGASVGLNANQSAVYSKGSEVLAYNAVSQSLCSFRGKMSAIMDDEDYGVMKGGVEVK